MAQDGDACSEGGEASASHIGRLPLDARKTRNRRAISAKALTSGNVAGCNAGPRNHEVVRLLLLLLLLLLRGQRRRLRWLVVEIE
jgi:hypothetical protein